MPPFRFPAGWVALVVSVALCSFGCRVPQRSVQVNRLPVLTLTHDDTVITQSCLLRIPTGLVIADTNGNGVLQIRTSQITVQFEPESVLRGAASGTPGDQLTGIGVRIEGATGVRLEGLRVHGFKNGLVASQADGLVIAGGDFSDNYRQRLASTAQAEAGSDWLFPHHNDDRRWRDEYGGAVCVEQSQRVEIHGIRVRRGQNGIVLDRVNSAAVYDNDCSFLTGWGLALWRSSHNMISRNAFDFCVRGHVEGVYNRGQDSAGILCFEQSNDNAFLENSVTHGGDGFFGFAGREAIGEVWMEQERARLRRETGKEDVESLLNPSAEQVRDLSERGCNRNLFVGNDFSYASAHGIEMTFSEDNVFWRNRVVGNAICGLWGGYSSRTRILDNDFADNGGMAYGLERGAINMEHAAENVILNNRFQNNKCGIHLWWDDDGALLRFPGVSGLERGVSGNLIVSNQFTIDASAPFPRLGTREKLLVLQLRDQPGRHVTNNAYFANSIQLTHPQAVEWAVEPGCEPDRTPRSLPPFAPGLTSARGTNHPVGARAHLRGRDQIFLDEWGPWDHATPWIRSLKAASGETHFELLGFSELPQVEVRQGDLEARVEPGTPPRLILRPRGESNSKESRITRYDVRVSAKNFERELRGTLFAATWQLTIFPWTDIDPRQDLAGWRRLAEGPGARRATIDVLNLPFGSGGPRNLNLSEAITREGPGPDHFGTVARTRCFLPAGRWRFTTLSDDGVRLQVNGRTLLENWTWHGPTENTAEYEQTTAGEVELVLEHFEIDGYAVLRLDLE